MSQFGSDVYIMFCRLIQVVVIIGIGIPAAGQSFVPVDYELIAHYPLGVSPDDTTGNNGPIVLTRAPFQNGGLFLNGIGSGGPADQYSDAETPSIPSMNLGAVAFSTEFNSDSLHGLPLIVAGRSFRWMAVFLRTDSLMNLRLNDLTQNEISTVRWNPGVWHELGVLVEDDTVSLYLDGQLGAKTEASLNTGDDRTVAYSHGGLGVTFYGTVRNLKIYTKDPVGTANEAGFELPQDRLITDIYPNPLTNSSRLWVHSRFDGPADISVHDILGRTVSRQQATVLRTGINQLKALPEGLSPGIYVVRVDAAGRTETRSIIIAN